MANNYSITKGLIRYFSPVTGRLHPALGSGETQLDYK